MNGWKKASNLRDVKYLEENNCILDFSKKPYSYMYIYDDYTIGLGYHHKTNQLILNFKKSMNCSISEKKHQEQAIEKIAKYYFDLLKKIKSNYIVILPPVSEENDRFLLLFQKIQEYLKHELSMIHLCTNAKNSLHSGKQERNPDVIYKKIAIKDMKKLESNRDKEDRTSYIALFIDDLLVSGATFKACSDFIRKKYSTIDKVYGLFIAKATY